MKFRDLFLILVTTLSCVSNLSAGPLEIVQLKPLSLCDNSVAEVAREVMKAQLPGYEDPKSHKDLNAYKEKIPTAVLVPEASPTVAVFPVKEIPNTYLVIASERLVLNLLLARASAAIEHNLFQTDEEFLKSDRLYRVGGHDLRGQDLLAYYELVMRDKLMTPIAVQNPERALLSLERNFWTHWVVPQLLKDPNFVVISAAASKEVLKGTIGHEAFHARYFTDAKFKKLVDDFYASIPDSDKEVFLAALEHHYTGIRADPILAANEFQAYMLMPDAENYLKNHRDERLHPLGKLAEFYTRALNEYLKERGVAPLEIKIDLDEPPAPPPNPARP